MGESENGIIVGPHAFVISKLEDVHCANEQGDQTATCALSVVWGQNAYKEFIIADLRHEQGEWRVLNSKSVIQKLN